MGSPKHYLCWPQVWIFSVQRQPRNETNIQCTHRHMTYEWMETGYTMANLFFLYGLPLTIIVTCYTTISCIMVRRTRADGGGCSVGLRVIADPGESCTTFHKVSDV